jgi:dihydroorotate dehydrogenase (fumarate)
MWVVRRVTELGYRYVAKPIMFRRTPDAVHHGLIRTAKRVQAIPGVRALPQLWSYRHPMLETEVAGVAFRNPIGLSAGFDKTIEMPPLMKRVGFGWMTGGSVTWGAYEGNEKPWFHRLPNSKSLVVHAGLPSEGTSVVAARVAQYPRHLFAGFPLNVSVAKTNSRESVGDDAGVKDYCESLAVFDRLHEVSLLEINISCPNTFGGEPFTTPARLEKLLQGVDALQLSRSVFIKMPINVTVREFDALLATIAAHRVAGVTIGNLMKDRKKVKLKDPLPDDVKGNLSGRPTKDLTTELVRRTYRAYGDKLVIIGVGGVMSADDAYEKIKAGASLVALITGLIYEGPQLPGDINRGLVRLLKHDGYQSVADAVGVDVSV